MKPLLSVFHLLVIAPAILGQPFGLNLAEVSAPTGWHAQSLTEAIGYMVLFGFIGILLAIGGLQAVRQMHAR